MTAEQLQDARAAAWRQQGNGLLTADDAAQWLREAGFTLFLPRPAQLPAPAASFVEATDGKASPTPGPAAIENAFSLLRRLLAAGDAIALSLLGGPGPGARSLGAGGDQPDFLATAETLPFLFALRGDREWTRGPRGKSSPLVFEVWKALDRDGALTADEVKDHLGRQLTETAALRALTELWTSLRIEPVYSDQEGTRWQLLEVNHEKVMIAGSAMAQGMALSALVSVYLQTAIAATSEEIEAYLSPLASRSRIRDAVRGLLATRQLGLRNLGASEHFFVEGSLPEFELPAVSREPGRPGAVAQDTYLQGSAAPPDLLAETGAPAGLVVGGADSESSGDLRIEALSEAETEHERTAGEGRKRFVAQRAAQTGDRKSFAPRPAGGRKVFGGERKAFGGERQSFSRGPRAGAGEAGKPFHAREPWKEDSRSARPAGEAQGRPSEGERRPFRAAGEGRPPGGARKPFAKPFSAGGGKPFRKEGDRRPLAPGAAPDSGPRKPFVPREGARPFSGGDRKPFKPREGGFAPSSDRKPFKPREGGFAPSSDRKPFKPREGGFAASGDRKPFKPREGGFAASGDRKPFKPREGGFAASSDRKPFKPREGGFAASSDRKPFKPREGGFAASSDRKPFKPREGGFAASSDRKPFAPREGGRPASGSGERRPFAPRAGGPSAPGGRKPFTPRGEGRPFSPRAAGAGTPFRRNTGEGAAGTGGAPKRFSPAGERSSRPETGTGKPGKRPRTSPFTSSGKPRAGTATTGRPGPRSARPGGTGKPASGRKSGAGPRKPGAGPRKPGGKGPRRQG